MASRTVIGPLTTTWTQPAACSAQIAECTFGCTKAFVVSYPHRSSIDHALR